MKRKFRVFMKSGEVHTIQAETPREALFSVQSLSEKIQLDFSPNYIKDDEKGVLYKVIEAQIIEIVSAESL